MVNTLFTEVYFNAVLDNLYNMYNFILIVYTPYTRFGVL